MIGSMADNVNTKKLKRDGMELWTDLSEITDKKVKDRNEKLQNIYLAMPNTVLPV